MSSGKHKAVIFDRDGTLIIDKIYLNDPDAIEYFPEAFEALRRLRDAGFVFAVATNQSGIPRGLVTPENLFEIHRRIRAEFSRHGIDFLEFYYAPYMTDSGHYMRKPQPGMLETAAKNHDLDLSSSWMIGDKMVDVKAGINAGCRSIMLTTTGHSPAGDDPKPVAICDNLIQVADVILDAPAT